MLSPTLFRRSAIALAVCAAPYASAYELYADDDSHLNASVEAVIGVFHSQENYGMTGQKAEGSSSWREGYI